MSDHAHACRDCDATVEHDAPDTECGFNGLCDACEARAATFDYDQPAGPYERDEWLDEYPITTPRMRDIPRACEWFALCTNDATSTMPHPVLGDVPICQRCRDKVDRLRDI